jgi:hypothetical protein
VSLPVDAVTHGHRLGGRLERLHLYFIITVLEAKGPESGRQQPVHPMKALGEGPPCLFQLAEVVVTLGISFVATELRSLSLTSRVPSVCVVCDSSASNFPLVLC